MPRAPCSSRTWPSKERGTLIVCGAVALGMAIWTKGLWGAMRERTGLELFPVGFRLAAPVAHVGTRYDGRGVAERERLTDLQR